MSIGLSNVLYSVFSFFSLLPLIFVTDDNKIFQNMSTVFDIHIFTLSIFQLINSRTFKVQARSHSY